MIRPLWPSLEAARLYRADPAAEVAEAIFAAELAGKKSAHISSNRCRRAMPAEAPRILVVEDDPEMRHFYIQALAEDGFTIDEAHNGHQALEKALKSAPDLIVTDIAVPGIDGIELCRRLRADDRTRHVPVLAITGYGDREYPARAMSAGAAFVLTKPCEPERLIQEARRLILNTSRTCGCS